MSESRDIAVDFAPLYALPATGAASGFLHELWAGFEAAVYRLRLPAYRRETDALLRELGTLDGDLQGLEDGVLRDRCRSQGCRLGIGGFKGGDLLVQFFASLAEVSWRTLGLYPHPAQFAGVRAILQGNLPEMATGEGKTLVAALAAAAAALGGHRVHVVTVNDYLAQRDAQWVEPLFHFLGLSVGVVVQSSDAAQRADHYRQPVCYCTNAELVFDYLRDLSCLRSRGPLSELSAERYHPPQDMRRIPSLDFAIVDEADSILIDEARTPLILSAAQGRQIEEAVVARVVDYAQTLELERHYRLSAGATRVQLTERGIADARQAFADAQSGALFLDSYREELIVMALTALRLYHRDEHYLVKDEQVQIIDEYTGRAMPDRRWSAGLHQMVEYKEACPQSEPNHTVARISYQRFFTRYQTLAGMTGTAAEVAPELWRIYGLRVIPVATHRPVKRKLLADRVYADREQKLQALVERVTAIHSSGAPVLIGTRTVGASVEVASMLSEAGLNYDCLNAADDAQEADIVARAGERGSITVATNMAGRGTDIPLGDGVEALGGLHVLMTERHDAGRIDRQLMGRCGRQGSAGCFEVLQSLDDPLVRWVRPVWLLYLARVLLPVDGGWLARYLLARGQRRLEREHSRIRQRLYRSDQSEAEMLAFAGRSE